MTPTATRRRATQGLGACVLGLALLTSGCAGISLGPASSDVLFDSYDDDGDDMFSQPEWDQVRIGLDVNRDGVVSRDELNAALGGGR